MGLPTPNLFAGGHLFHSRCEWVAVEDMCRRSTPSSTRAHLVGEEPLGSPAPFTSASAPRAIAAPRGNMESCSPEAQQAAPADAYTKLGRGRGLPPDCRRPGPAGRGLALVGTLGLMMVVLWSAACIYVALKAGSGIEAAIPIAVMAIFFGKLREGAPPSSRT